jgi:hypothetical protein
MPMHQSLWATLNATKGHIRPTRLYSNLTELSTKMNEYKLGQTLVLYTWCNKLRGPASSQARHICSAQRLVETMPRQQPKAAPKV